jgi:aminocarboxymuconate-semialdehyde decarboxylase
VKIDIHAHIMPKQVFKPFDDTPRWPIFVTGADGKEEIQDIRRKSIPLEAKQMYDPVTRLKTMEKTGVDLQVLSSPPALMYYQIEDESALAFAQAMNDALAEIVAQYPNRFVGLASVPLQAPKMAALELRRAVIELGLAGVEILTNIAGRQLDWEELDVFWHEVQSLDVPVLLHPYNVTGADRMNRYYLTNLIGNPLDTALAAIHIIFGGVLDRFSKLVFCLSHAGGVLPYIIGRCDHGFKVRGEPKTIVRHKPTEYLRSFYFDTIAHAQPALDFLIRLVGADRVVMGTDYPFDMADPDPVRTVESLDSISDEQKTMIMEGNSRRLFRIRDKQQ